MAAVLALCSLLLPTVIGTRSEVRECAFSDHLQQRRAGPQSSANQLPGEGRDNGTVRCGRGLACFGFWEQRPGGEVLLLRQGCWTSQPDCLSDLCMATAPPAHIHKGTYRFCCCSRDLCNTRFREASPTTPPPVHRLPDASGLPGNSPAVVAVGTVAVALIAVALLFCGYSLLKGKKKLSSSSVNIPGSSSSTPCGDVDDLRLWELLGRGRFASVYRGSVSDRVVAVKVFSSAQRQKYANQRVIYRLPLLRQQHDLAHFLSAHESTDREGSVQHYIIMDYYPHGSLSDFLCRSCVDWVSCCRMMLGVTRGLSFLHSELQAGDQSKPAVVHRDVSSANVLVRSDMSCVLSGFSLAMSLRRDPGSVAISEAGSLRYRAPELLSGALDLREYGTALKQVDVYALGLLFWESFRRCHDLFPVKATPHFEQAFESELGLEPTLEDMHELVTKGKYRPVFPPHWKLNSPVLRLLKETMEDCWDQDTEARLSAQCTEERLSQLSQLSFLTAPGPRSESNGSLLPTGCTSPSPEHVHGAQGFQDTPERTHQQVLPQRPCSLQLLSTATPTGEAPQSRERPGASQSRERPGTPQSRERPGASQSRERPGAPQSRERPGAPQSRERQVETGVAKLNAVAVPARVPMTVTLATNRGKVLMAGGSSAGAPTLVANTLRGRGVTNRAGPQTEEIYRSSDEVTLLEQEAGLNIFWSPDEDQPLLKNEVPPAGARLSMQSNANNNNNYCSFMDSWTAQRTEHSDGTRPQTSLAKTWSIDQEFLSKDIPLCQRVSDVTIEVLNCAPLIQSDQLGCTNEVQLSIFDKPETADILVGTPKDTADQWNMDIVNTPTSEEPYNFTVRNIPDLSYSSAPEPVSQISSEHPAEVSISPVSAASVSTHAISSAAVSHASSDLVESAPARPCSLDLSTASVVTDGAPLSDLGLSASGEKIRRRVKTPYTLKKWRPASWAPPADHQPVLFFQVSPNCPRINQSKSSMAVVHLGGRPTAPSGPDGLTSF